MLNVRNGIRMSVMLSEGEKNRLMECVGLVLAGKIRVLHGYRVKVLGYDHIKKGVVIQYLDNKEISVLTKIHEIRRLI